MEIFYPTCTFPSDEAGIVASPDMRGTLDILWSCLAVVILCTWVVLHENVPAEGDTDSDWFWGRLFLEAYLAAQKTCSFLFALFAPELFTGKAMMSLYFAHHVQDIMRKTVKEDEVNWTISHAFLANMGGFAIDFTKNTKVLGSNPDPQENERLPARQNMAERHAVDISNQNPTGIRSTTLSRPASSEVSLRQLEEQNSRELDHPATTGPPAEHDLLRTALLDLREKHPGNKWFIFPIPKVVQGRWREDGENLKLIQTALETMAPNKLGFQSAQSYIQNLMALRGNIWVIDGIQLEYARRTGIISSIPGVTSDEIMDKSKGDWVTKALAILQVAWLRIQLIVRRTQNLTATQLEIMTAAFATCSIIT
ncbi:hypothetical protein B0I37DRAFT_440096 [Chaetomium sp. MPI-CAGE-AT-0009]|nr:hypothetical protein B0I37DRAFT_440096 [Chaetomium sp. MPI-CAGE-AT-0009]